VSKVTRPLLFNFFVGFSRPPSAASVRRGRELPIRPLDPVLALGHLLVLGGLVLALVGVATHQLAFLKNRVVPEDLERLFNPDPHDRTIRMASRPIGVSFQRTFQIPHEVRVALFARIDKEAIPIESQLSENRPITMGCVEVGREANRGSDDLAALGPRIGNDDPEPSSRHATAGSLRFTSRQTSRDQDDAAMLLSLPPLGIERSVEENEARPGESHGDLRAGAAEGDAVSTTARNTPRRPRWFSAPELLGEEPIHTP